MIKSDDQLFLEGKDCKDLIKNPALTRILNEIASQLDSGLLELDTSTDIEQIRDLTRSKQLLNMIKGEITKSIEYGDAAVIRIKEAESQRISKRAVRIFNRNSF